MLVSETKFHHTSNSGAEEPATPLTQLFHDQHQGAGMDSLLGERRQRGTYFSSSLLKRIAALDLDLGVTIYFLDEPDEECAEALKNS
jgi:hypothetical protein